jgi:hypothetical protein
MLSTLAWPASNVGREIAITMRAGGIPGHRAWLMGPPQVGSSFNIHKQRFIFTLIRSFKKTHMLANRHHEVAGRRHDLHYWLMERRKGT